MNWKRVARACMCLLVVCCVLLNVCAIPAKATGLGGLLTASTVAVPGVNVVTAVLIGLGVLYVVGSTDWEELVRDVDTHLKNSGFYDAAGNVTAYITDTATGAFSVASDLIQSVWDYLWSSGTLEEGKDYSHAETGFVLCSSDAPLHAYWKSINIYSLVSSASPDSFLLTSCRGSSLSNVSSWYGLGLRYNSTFDCNVLMTVVTSDLQNYTSVSFPFGTFADWEFSGSVGADFTNDPSGRGNVSMFCLSYADAEQVYLNNLASSPEIYFITPDSYILPRYGRMSFVDSACLYNVGYINRSSGAVTFLDYVDLLVAYDYNGYIVSGLCPSYSSEDCIVSDSDVTLGQLADPDEEVSVGYPVWFGNGTTVSNPETQTQTQVVPIPNVNANTDLSTLTQEDVWSGTLSDAIVDANTGTVSGTPIADFWAGLTNAIVTPLLEGIASIFIPSEDFVTAKFEALRSEFAFADSIMGTAELFVPLLQGLEPTPPVIYIDLGASTGDYDFGGKVPFVDLRWYAEYKPTVDALLSAFMWLVFLWRVFIRLPGIISGVPFFVPDSIVPNGEEKTIVVQRWNK